MTSWTADQLQAIHRMLNPVSIAVVGATPRLQYGGRFLRAALQAGDRVRIYPVNPRYDEIMGLKSYASLADVPESPDVVGIVVPYHQVMPRLVSPQTASAPPARQISGVDGGHEPQSPVAAPGQTGRTPATVGSGV
jgi:predicted CoA-binding protein